MMLPQSCKTFHKFHSIPSRAQPLKGFLRIGHAWAENLLDSSDV